MKILIVDDKRSNAETLCKLLVARMDFVDWGADPGSTPPPDFVPASILLSHA